VGWGGGGGVFFNFGTTASSIWGNWGLNYESFNHDSVDEDAIDLVVIYYDRDALMKVRNRIGKLLTIDRSWKFRKG
jgi:hypothetical protein